MIIEGLCISYKRELFAGIHEAADDYRIALYTEFADLSPRTTKYTREFEVDSEGGYEAGGLSLEGRSVGSDGGVAWVTFDSPVWDNSTIRARGAMVYNATRQNRAVAVFDFGQTKQSINGPFRVVFPPAGAATALIAIE